MGTPEKVDRVRPSENAERVAENAFSGRCRGCKAIVAAFHGVCWREPGEKWSFVACETCAPRTVARVRPKKVIQHARKPVPRIAG